MTDQAISTDLHEYRPTVPTVYVLLAWLWAGVPFAYGGYELLLKVKQLFEG